MILSFFLPSQVRFYFWTSSWLASHHAAVNIDFDYFSRHSRMGRWVGLLVVEGIGLTCLLKSGSLPFFQLGVISLVWAPSGLACIMASDVRRAGRAIKMNYLATQERSRLRLCKWRIPQQALPGVLGSCYMKSKGLLLRNRLQIGKNNGTLIRACSSPSFSIR